MTDKVKRPTYQSFLSADPPSTETTLGKIIIKIHIYPGIVLKIFIHSSLLNGNIFPNTQSHTILISFPGALWGDKYARRPETFHIKQTPRITLRYRPINFNITSRKDALLVCRNRLYRIVNPARFIAKIRTFKIGCKPGKKFGIRPDIFGF
jgi:hypothetical protein